MGSRRSLSVVASLAFGALLACLLSGQSSPAQPPGPPPAAPPPHGRYQMEVVRAASGGNFSTVFICDTHTGHVWYRETLEQTTEWTDMGAPPTERDRGPKRRDQR